jgi:hypothetical protein
MARVERILGAAEFHLEATYYDEHRRFALHLARGDALTL